MPGAHAPLCPWLPMLLLRPLDAQYPMPQLSKSRGWVPIHSLPLPLVPWFPSPPSWGCDSFGWSDSPRSRSTITLRWSTIMIGRSTITIGLGHLGIREWWGLITFIHIHTYPLTASASKNNISALKITQQDQPDLYNSPSTRTLTTHA